MNSRNNGSGQGSGQGLGRGGGRGRNGGGGFGLGGNCVCPKCNTIIAHETGTRCTQIKCPKCGATMIREELMNNRRK